MRRIFIILFICSLSSAIFAQEGMSLSKSYSSQTFTEFARELKATEGIQIFYTSSLLDSMITPGASKGSQIEDLLKRTFKGTNLSYFIESRSIYIFEGDPIVSDLPEYIVIQAMDPVQKIPGQDSIIASGEYLQINNISEENFISIGSKKADKGKFCQINGLITNQQNGEALIGATIYLEETSTGYITDVNGRFKLSLKPGSYHIIVDHMAMKGRRYGLNVLSDGNFSIALENDLIELEEVTVSDKRHDNVKSMMMGFDRITVKSIKEVPVVLGEKDVLKIVQMLPGVQNAGEGSSGFNVRGGSADQNMFYINKVSVYNTSHLFGFFTAFSPDVISDFSLYKNNVPSKYGGRIASIFEISTRQGNKENFFAQGGLSPITGHIAVEGPIVKEKVSFVASLRSTYSDWILKRMNDQDLRQSDASFYDGTIGVNANINAKNQVRAFFYQSSDKFSLSVRNNYSYSNTGGSLIWKHNFTPSLSADFSLSSSNYQFSTVDKNNITEAYSHDYYIKHNEARADFLITRYENHRIEFGVNSILYDLNRGEIEPFGSESRRLPISLGTERGIENAVYISDEFRLSARVNFLLGMRYSHYGNLGPTDVNIYEEGLPKNKYTYLNTLNFNKGELSKTYSGFEPRAALNFRLSNYSSIKASYNRLQQYIFLLSNTVAVAPNDQWKLTDYHISPPVADQLSVGYYQDFRDAGVNLSFELYRKWVKNVVEYRDGADFISPEPLETQILQGNQDSYGVELMLKKTKDNLTGWLSYTYSRSMVVIDGIYDDMKVNSGNPYPSNYDRPHSLNLVSNYRVSRRLSFSANVVYATGRPVTLPVAVYYSEQQPFLLYSSRNAYRIPDYFRVDLSANLEGNLKFKKVAHSFWMLNVYNLLGRDNAYSVFYEVENGEINGYQLSIFAKPIVTLSWNFKFGNYNSD